MFGTRKTVLKFCFRRSRLVKIKLKTKFYYWLYRFVRVSPFGYVMTTLNSFPVLQKLTKIFKLWALIFRELFNRFSWNNVSRMFHPHSYHISPKKLNMNFSVHRHFKTWLYKLIIFVVHVTVNIIRATIWKLLPM
jgi:hypothetical protein